MSLRFSRKQRLKGYKIFSKVLSEGKKANSQFFLVSVLKNESDETRIGIAVAKKIKRSVDRNRLKRLIREIYRLNQMNMNKGFDFVVIAKEKALHLKFGEIENILLPLLKKEKIFREK